MLWRSQHYRLVYLINRWGQEGSDSIRELSNDWGGKGGEVLLSSYNESPNINVETNFAIVWLKRHTLVTFATIPTQKVPLCPLRWCKGVGGWAELVASHYYKLDTGWCGMATGLLQQVHCLAWPLLGSYGDVGRGAGAGNFFNCITQSCKCLLNTKIRPGCFQMSPVDPY